MSTDRQWWKSAVVYQIYPRSFADSNGDGIGDLAGITGHLDHLSLLGVDVVWLSPVYPSPQDDNGYDISDYQGIDPTFGTLAEFDELLAAVHDRGMKLVMDLVVNHTSDEHPWFVESPVRPHRTPKRDWYWWRPAREGMAAGAPGAEPTNWASFFSGPAWQLDEASGEYYLHLFSRKQPDLNWENPQVREAVYAMMRWWLDRGVDGFRMDVINMISKDVALPDGHLPPGQHLGDGSPYFLCGPRIHEFLQEMHREVFAGRDAAAAHRRRDARRHRRARRACSPTPPAREVDMVFQFEHVSLDQGGEQVGRAARCSCATSRRPSGAGRPAWPTPAGTASTGTTTTSRGPSRGSATTASLPRRGPPRRWRRSCTSTAARPTSTRARSWA